jgi:hypothetical protein
MNARSDAPSATVARGLAQRRSCERATYLRELLAYAAAGLAVIEAPAAAAETLYRLADAVVERGPA